jgi:prepilin-type N-terminal cleavage/methylation domain-containing protein
MTKYTQTGLTLLETLIAVAIASVLIAAISGVISTALNTGQTIHMQNDTLQQARFAMQRMSRAVSKSRQLRIPLGENTDPITSPWSESVRNVLAVSLDPTLDRNKDGWGDANNDKDFLDIPDKNGIQNGTRDAGEPERIDEDTGVDNNNDGFSGIKGIDDNGDGQVDGKNTADNDEDGGNNEDSMNITKDDLTKATDDDPTPDGSIDEDTDKDMNGDGYPGIFKVDDDYDKSIDEGNSDDDDEDGLRDEDWVDEQVFFLNNIDPKNIKLMERMPNINPVDGAAYTEYPIAENVSQFRVERVLGANGSTVLVDITLTLSPSGGEPVSLNTRVGVSSGL